MIEVLVITISNPLLIGIYENKKLVKEYKLDGKTSDLLPTLFEKLLKDFDIKKVIYVNSPGSFMAIKVAYIFLKTISISIQGIKFTDAHKNDWENIKQYWISYFKYVNKKNQNAEKKTKNGSN